MSLQKVEIVSNGLIREFYLACPSGNELHPILLAFHGGGGTALNADKHYNFSELATAKGFIVIYPQGINKQWSDGRIAPAKGEAFDDVKFVSEILRKLPAICPQADTSKVFCTGISNGGFFSIFLAWKLNTKVTAIAPVCASIPGDIGHSITLPRPIPMLLIAGTEDPLVKYEGGWVGFRDENKGRGYAMPVEWTIRKWLEMNDCISTPIEKSVRNLDDLDGCTARIFIYPKSENPCVEFIRIEGGGHTWPGGRQYLPKRLVGNLCRDFSASAMILEFFAQFNQ